MIKANDTIIPTGGEITVGKTTIPFKCKGTTVDISLNDFLSIPGVRVTSGTLTLGGEFAAFTVDDTGTSMTLIFRKGAAYRAIRSMSHAGDPAIAGADTDEPTPVAAVKARRGRPKKAEVVAVEGLPVPKRRGRPPKALAAGETTDAPPKRKRGRPPKVRTEAAPETPVTPAPKLPPVKIRRDDLTVDEQEAATRWLHLQKELLESHRQIIMDEAIASGPAPGELLSAVMAAAERWSESREGKKALNDDSTWNGWTIPDDAVSAPTGLEAAVILTTLAITKGVKNQIVAQTYLRDIHTRVPALAADGAIDVVLGNSLWPSIWVSAERRAKMSVKAATA